MAALERSPILGSIDESIFISDFGIEPQDNTNLYFRLKHFLWLIFIKCLHYVIPSRDRANSKKLGTIMGVLIPNILSIFGVILFLRLGMIVGYGGILGSMAMYTAGYTVVVLTSLSISAISTNGVIKGGGAYYLISRSLGPELGGSVGIIYYFGNIAAAALHLVGFVDTLNPVFLSLPNGSWWLFLYASITLFFVTIIVLVGAQFFAKTSFLIFLVLFLSLVMTFSSFIFQKPDVVPGYTGFRIGTLIGNTFPSFSQELSFTTIFGILFPSCTGIMSGVNMSGDLKNSSKSIPNGTLSAVAITFVVYIALILCMGFTMTKDSLLSNYNILSETALVPIIVTFGVWAATLSSALSSIIGASRILQAVAKDKLLPYISFLGKGSGSNNEPRIAILATYALVQVALLLGNLDVIAPIQTMFFVLSYGFTNFACFALSITGAPNWRPLFKYYSWLTALIGAILCIVIMFLVNALHAALALLLQICLVVAIRLYSPPSQQWGDISQALIYHQVRKYLLLLDEKKGHVKYWRMQPLLCVSNPRSSFPLIHFINNLKKGGVYIVGNVIVGDFESNIDKINHNRSAWYQFIHDSKFKAFPEIILANSIRSGIQNLMLTSGIGGMRPNTVILGFYDSEIHCFNEESFPRVKDAINLFPEPVQEESKLLICDYVSTIQDALALNKNVIVSRGFEKMDRRMLQPNNMILKMLKKKIGYIDIWPLQYVHVANDLDHSVSYALQLAYMINQVDIWSRFHTLRLCGFIFEGENLQSITRNYRRVLTQCRVKATVKIVVVTEEEFRKFITTDPRLHDDEVYSEESHIHSVDEISIEISCASDDTDIDDENLETRLLNDSLTEGGDVLPREGIKKTLDPFVNKHWSQSRLIYQDFSPIQQKQFLNRIMRRNSQQTSIIFTTLPTPPQDPSCNEAYFEEIKTLSNKLPPTLLSYSRTNVISLEM